ncbi:hypothetical protein OS493_024286 [Desmophyllum pertusum]|uniref:BEN domain-containing protein n=1 Tax=Desmophyllum pertusum TaxID=174260 RepID=A0A9X0CQ66_9CNID|nr:hypothetical protein OS493_024286 [Desmophyllum pertusum]
MAYRNLTKVPKLCLVYFSIDKTTCIVDTKKIRSKDSGEPFSNVGPESGAKVTLRSRSEFLEAMVIASDDNEEQLNRKERSFVEDPVNAHLFAEEETRTRKRQQPPNPGQSAKRARTQDNQNDNEAQMLQTFLAEQEARQARIKQQRVPKSNSRDASIQCDRNDAATPSQKSDVAVQTDFVDVMGDLREQVQNLTQIVAELTALKSQKQRESTMIHRPLLAELLSDDTLSDLAEFCPDSSENCSVTAAETPLPGLQLPSVVGRPDAFAHQPLSNSSPVTYPSRAPLTVVQQNRQVNNPTHGPTDEQRRQVEAILFMGKEMSTTALASVDVLFTESELANGNTGGTFGYAKLDEHKLNFLCLRLRQKFDSPSFAGQWENVRIKINSKCRGKRRTVVKRLKQNASQ